MHVGITGPIGPTGPAGQSAIAPSDVKTTFGGGALQASSSSPSFGPLPPCFSFSGDSLVIDATMCGGSTTIRNVKFKGRLQMACKIPQTSIMCS